MVVASLRSEKGPDVADDADRLRAVYGIPSLPEENSEQSDGGRRAKEVEYLPPVEDEAVEDGAGRFVGALELESSATDGAFRAC